MVIKKILHCITISLISSVYAGRPADEKAIKELTTEIKVEMILAAGHDTLNYNLLLLCRLAQSKKTSLAQSFTDTDARNILLQNNVNPFVWTPKVKYLQALTHKENPFE